MHVPHETHYVSCRALILIKHLTPIFRVFSSRGSWDLKVYSKFMLNYYSLWVGGGWVGGREKNKINATLNSSWTWSWSWAWQFLKFHLQLMDSIYRKLKNFRLRNPCNCLDFVRCLPLIINPILVILSFLHWQNLTGPLCLTFFL